MSKTVKEDISFEQGLEQLEKIVHDLETGKTNLEDSIQAYEKGMELKKVCEDKLKQAQLRIEKISVQGDTVKSEPFDVE